MEKSTSVQGKQTNLPWLKNRDKQEGQRKRKHANMGIWKQKGVTNSLQISGFGDS